jgi:uncharacterized damage-inducible protein DinB
MKEILQQYSAFNYWANEKLLDVALSLSEEQQKANVPSSFPSVHATFLHIWDAESIWWQRIKLHERIVVPSENFNPTMKEISNGLLSQSKQWAEWTQEANENALDHVFAYYNSKKEYFKMPVWKTLMQVFNHGSYHRGQIVTILRNLNVTKIPSTDFMAFSRKK